MLKKRLCSRRLMKNMLQICYLSIAFDFVDFWQLLKSWSYVFFSFFFPNLIYMPEHILDEKGMDAIFKQKDKKIVNWHKNGSFSVVFKVKGCYYHMYIISRVCPTYILFYILLMVYHLFIWHYIFKNHIGRKDF